jgi:hypothetical protein
MRANRSPSASPTLRASRVPARTGGKGRRKVSRRSSRIRSHCSVMLTQASPSSGAHAETAAAVRPRSRESTTDRSSGVMWASTDGACVHRSP